MAPERTTLELQLERHVRRGELSEARAVLERLCASFPDDQELADHFGPLATTLADNEDTIVTELNKAQGNPVDIGGYYYPDREKTTAVMRPSKTLNEALEAAAVAPVTKS